jgi:C4-dicarboxylate-specific signal transduction histidine kinase
MPRSSSACPTSCWRAVDAGATAAAVADAVRADRTECGLAISVTVQEEPVIVSADSVRLEQICTNWLSLRMILHARAAARRQGVTWIVGFLQK